MHKNAEHEFSIRRNIKDQISPRSIPEVRDSHRELKISESLLGRTSSYKIANS